jgi:hypothetical protein
MPMFPTTNSLSFRYERGNSNNKSSSREPLPKVGTKHSKKAFNSLTNRVKTKRRLGFDNSTVI